MEYILGDLGKFISLIIFLLFIFGIPLSLFIISTLHKFNFYYIGLSLLGIIAIFLLIFYITANIAYSKYFYWVTI